MTLASKVRTAFALGLPNLARVFLYRLSVRLNVNPVRRLSIVIPSGAFFRFPVEIAYADLEINDQWLNQHSYFGWHRINSHEIPNWHENPFSGAAVKNPSRSWWSIPDFDSELGDIKTVWEASRFDWLLGFAQHARQGNKQSLRRLNSWIQNWVENNPPYLGVNWKCGQEASFRVMHLAMAALILDQVQNSESALNALVKAHLMRIAPTISYAMAQDNNHGTSEAAALFIGGSWLALQGDVDGERWQKLGRRWLENRAQRLIETDGSFSQYSVTYHRVMLDTFSIVEVWRRSLNLPTFSVLLYDRVSKATTWLYQFTQFEAGDVPNLGANDGARLLPLTATGYRDFRPSVQLAMVLFNNCCAWPDEGSWNLPLHWLEIDIPVEEAEPQSSIQFDEGGYSLLRVGHAFVILSYPQFRFRPSQNDSLHVDFWLNGINLLRDAGSYSYNSGNEYICYFGGAESHNTVQFDDRNHMPRLGRFLLGDWLKSEGVTPITKAGDHVQCAAGYTDRRGSCHYRAVTLNTTALQVVDEVSGFHNKAILRWRLQPGDWLIKGTSVTNGTHLLKITSSTGIARFEISQGFESLFYMKKTALPVLEVEVHQSAKIISEYLWEYK
jgi:hypothetical protein